MPYQVIGKTTRKNESSFRSATPNAELRTVLDEDMRVLRDIWEETSHQLDLLQRNPENIREERKNIYDRKGPSFVDPFSTVPTTDRHLLQNRDKPKVAVIREEGSNGDREMVSAFFLAGFEPWDVTVTDLLEGRITLDQFRGVVFVGGFSYADVLDSAKGWAASIRFNKKVWDQFEKFYHRPDTFSLGVCNGCQLMALLGWVPWRGIADELQPRFIHNKSGQVRIALLDREDPEESVDHAAGHGELRARHLGGPRRRPGLLPGQEHVQRMRSTDLRRSATWMTNQRSPKPIPSIPTARLPALRVSARPTAATSP